MQKKITNRAFDTTICYIKPHDIVTAVKQQLYCYYIIGFEMCQIT